MPLFQTSVLKKSLEEQNKSAVKNAYGKFKKYFFNTTIQQNIRESKEEQFQEGFLRELFVNVLGYTINPNPDYNLTTEFKNQTGAKKADGAILVNGDALAVIELKSTKTKDLEKIRQQAFDYKSHQPTCVYVITSNFERLRFYINNSVDFEEFDLFTITPARFELFYLCLAKENLTKNIPLQTKEASVVEEEKVTKKLYADYSLFKREIFRDIVKRNMNNPTLRELTEKDIKKTLFKKTQKLLDRFLFIFFAEDRGLLPPNSISRIIDKWQDDVAFGDDRSLYDIYKRYFNVLNVGRPKQGNRQEIFAYNGGLFKTDAILDTLEIDNDLLLKHTSTLTKYDFETDVDVNILGHIFENSLNEIESINAEIEGVEFDKQKTKRKKDGVFYTPKYITKYIVDNTIGKLCEEKKKELEINDDVYLYAKQRSKKRIENLEEYRKWLLQLTICDPACGSGAFLNQALDFLIKEHEYIDRLTAKYHNVPLVLSNIENSILENNIYGVDLNEESVEIAKLSLWLRTAQKGRKLTSLSSNIKCGNSLIDSKAVAGDKAFDWEKEFPQVFKTTKTKLTKKEIDEIEKTNPDYLELIEQNAKLAQEKAEQSVKLSQEAIMYSKKVYELTQKQKLIVNEAGELYGINKGGFDVVIGNPPYVFGGNEGIGIDEKRYFKNQYETGSGKINLFTLFIEKSYNIIANKGEFSFIIPNTFLRVTSYHNSRKFFIDRFIFRELADLGNDVFEGAVTTAIIITASKNNSILNKNKEIKIIKDFNGKYTTLGISDIKENNYVITSNLSNEKLKLIKKLKNNSILLGQECSEMIFGVVITKNKDEVIFKEPKEGFLPFLEGKDIGAYFIRPIHNYINYKPELLHRARTKKIFEAKEKLLVQRITGGSKPIKVAYDNNKYYNKESINNIILSATSKFKHKTILLLLNSTLINWYYNNQFTNESTLTVNISKEYLSKIPVKLPSNQEYFIEIADVILSKTNKFLLLTEKFLKYILSKYSIVESSRKLKNWHELEFAEFIKELNKAIKKASGKKLSKTDEFEWLELFENKKAEAQKLKAEIEKTDKEIDQMVYKLYDLTEEEIAIVEN